MSVCFIIDFSSPHETGDTLQNYLDKFDKTMQSRALNTTHRWNFAVALQVSATDYLPGGADVIKAFMKRFAPERVRAIILFPNWVGNELSPQEMQSLVALRALPNCEVMTVDSTCRNGNGLMYSDFFDFS